MSNFADGVDQAAKVVQATGRAGYPPKRQLSPPPT